MKRHVSFALAAVLALGAARASGAEPAPAAAKDGMLQRALADELERSMARLALPGMPRPYYLAYEVTDHDQLTFGALMGALVTRDRERGRFLRVVVRVGSPELDNTNVFGDFRGFDHPAQLPVEEDYGAIRRRVWLATDEAYKDAVEALEKKRAALSTQSASTDDVADFSPAPVTRVVGAAPPLTAEESSLVDLVKDASAVYRDVPEVQAGKAAVVVTRTRRLFVSSDGALVDEPRTVVRFDALAEGQAADGMDLERLVTYTVGSPGELPKADKIVQAVRDSAVDLARAGKAPAVAGIEKQYDELLAAVRRQNPKAKLVLGEPFLLPGSRNQGNRQGWSDGVAQLQAMVARLAERHGAALVRYQRLFDEALRRAPVTHWIWDGVHPTPAGHELLARAWLSAVNADAASRS